MPNNAFDPIVMQRRFACCLRAAHLGVVRPLLAPDKCLVTFDRTVNGRFRAMG
jgi:hypothetical protein